MIRVLLILCVSLFAASVTFAAPTLNDPNLTVSEVASGLNLPTTMAFIGQDDILVLQKNDGQVRRVIAGVLQPGSVLDLDVDGQSERGLLGITVHPDFPATPYVYLYFTENGGAGDSFGGGIANRVYRYAWDGNTLVTPGTLIVDLPLSPGPSHDGGVITFGPDGKLYIVIGDLNRNGQLQNNPGGAAPDDTSVILRLNDDGSTPGDNPFSSQGGNVAKYYAYGIRNSFGLAFDPVKNRLWMTENGPANYDEINLVKPGFNSGWKPLMGPESRNANSEADLFSLSKSRYADPQFSWFETIGVTGIAFLNSTELGPEYENHAFVGDVNNGNLYRFELNGRRDGFVLTDGLADRVADSVFEREDVRIGLDFNGITDLKVGPDGLLYVVSIGDGAIYVVGPTIVVGAASVPDAELAAPYDADLNLSGGTTPYALAVIDGTLPEGLNLAGEAIAGMPTKKGTSRFTLLIDDQGGASTVRKYKIKVYRALDIRTKSLKKGRVDRRYSKRLKAAGGKKPYAWSVAAGVLPDGLMLDPLTGKITGIPTTAENANLTFEVIDSLGVAVQKALTLLIE